MVNPMFCVLKSTWVNSVSFFRKVSGKQKAQDLWFNLFKTKSKLSRSYKFILQILAFLLLICKHFLNQLLQTFLSIVENPMYLLFSFVSVDAEEFLIT